MGQGSPLYELCRYVQPCGFSGVLVINKVSILAILVINQQRDISLTLIASINKVKGFLPHKHLYLYIIVI